MSEAEMLMVFCYDIADDASRRRVAARLEDVAVRVQDSVFELRATPAFARNLGQQLAQFLGSEDSLRVYAVGSAGLRHAQVHGAGAAPLEGDFYLV